ncbi:hypothetical protein [Subtercola lobariae]|uniref:Addiction module toxin, HicA family n=1 Tax=Subtercola lobariae TaxID=1588641 RepID=A0A917EYU3_9MICO|nr:hypothetical protein [Subtercola lobariae]GGF24155.1 hypothetical protein GCM10011399_17150 [Subtercola lobariae]
MSIAPWTANMRRRQIDRAIVEIARQAGLTAILMHGANHDKWYVNGVMVAVPRHREIGGRLAQTIIQQVKEATR